MRQFNIEIDKTSPKTSRFVVPANEHFSILVRYKNWEDKQEWLDYTLVDDSGTDVVKYKKESENDSALYFCGIMDTSTNLRFKTSTLASTLAPRDTIQVVAIASSSQDNCYICSADYARTTGEGGGGGVSQEYVDGKVQEEATARAAADEALRADIPTKTSQLSNDSGFLTEHQPLDDYYTKAEVDQKVQDEAGARVTSYDELKAAIPTKVSQLENDSGYLTYEGTIANADMANHAANADNAENVLWGNVQSKPTTLEGYGITDAATKAEIPTKTSQLSNDSGFLTKAGTIDHALSADTATTAATATTASSASSVPWTGVQNTPTTLTGYGITDAATKAEFDSLAAEVGTANAQLEEIA